MTPFVVVLAACAMLSGCGDCAGVGLSRLATTDVTIQVGASFTASYEEGGSCGGSSAPDPAGWRAVATRWRSADTTVISLDSLSGQVTGLKVGDAQVAPVNGVTTGPAVIQVHVR